MRASSSSSCVDGASVRNRTVAALLLAALLLVPGLGGARSTPDALPEVASTALPPEAREVILLIREGGPFPHDRDGVVFGNRERLLPAQPRGYYHEYTVRTPGARTRGARRIVCGGTPTAPDACFYTDDHYRSFRRIRE
jgi:ribonuclease T1